MKNRGFEVVTQYLNQDIRLPLRKTAKSAGYDIEAAQDTFILPGKVEFVPTGLKTYMNEFEVLQLYPRSSFVKNKNLSLINSVGIIDSDYYNNPENEGHILVMLYNFGETPQFVKKGERFCQAIFSVYLKVDSEASSSVKRLGGFGSTGL
ncbi:MAG: dUTP diphosphatase [Firmicutes bacterium]|nr:dUTP diphosphatase [Bacillota bacterium]